jgi:hypothetical protein
VLEAESQAPTAAGASYALVLVSPDWRADVEFRTTLTGADQRGRLLVWEGHGIQGVECLLDDVQRVTVSSWRHRRWVRLPPRRTAQDLVLRIRYSYDLAASEFVEGAIRDLPRSNLPRPLESSRHVTPLARLPWRDEPDLVVDLFLPQDGVVALGPQYEAQGPAPNGAHRFAFYDGSFFGAIQLGQFVPLDVRGEVILALRAQQLGEQDPLVAECAEVSSKARAYFRDLLGECPVRSPRVLVIDTSARVSFCVGSAVAINLHGWGSDPVERRDRLLSTVAHEFAHSWMVCGTCWSEADYARLVNEMLAAVLEADVVQSQGKRSSWGTFCRTSVWPKTLSGSIAPAQWLRTTGYYYGGMSASNLLTRVLRRRPHAVRAAIERIWRAGKEEVLSAARLKEVLKETLGNDVATAVEDALREPRPLRARARVTRSEERRRWGLVITPESRDGKTRLLGRLRAEGAGLLPEVRGNDLVYEVKSEDAVIERVLELQPFHLVLHRETRDVRVRLKPWSRRLWMWVTDSIAHAQTTSRLRLFVAGLLGIWLNAEHPAGYRAMAAALERSARSLSSRLLALAAARAVYPDEVPLRQFLR